MKSKRSNLARHSSASQAARSSVVVLALVLAVAALIGVAIYHFRSGPGPASESAQAGAADELDAARVNAEMLTQQVTTPRSAVTVRKPFQPKRADGSADNPAGGPGGTGADATATPEAQQAVARLSQLDVSHPLTAKQAAAVKQDLQQLVGQGPNALPAIQEFLKQNRDLSLDEMRGSNPVGYASVRAGMFDALRQIGGPGAQGILSDTLRSTGDPAEVGLLARHLEDLAPGQYREEAVQAARETLAQVAEGKMKADVGPLFQVLQTYGDSSVIADIQKSLPNWEHYGLMTLAGLPESQGVPALIENIQQSTAVGGSKSIFALQMLAQVAPQYPEASAALLEQAKSGQIPDRAWTRIAEALVGDQYQFAKDPNVDPTMLLRTPGTKTYHINNNNENFYSLPLSSAPEADLAQRQALIDQLLAANNNNPAAVQALQKAKASLPGGPK